VQDIQGRPLSTFSLPVQGAVHQLGLDAATAEVVAALDAEGVRSLLIKGPVMSRWLYDGSSSRAYVDIDLLVPLADRGRAERVLRRLGFTCQDAELTPGEISQLAAEGQLARHAREWLRPPGASVDLHHTILGVGVDSNELFDALTAGGERLTVAGRAVKVPGEPARALIVSLEAAKAGMAGLDDMGDLDRALGIVQDGVWRDAARIAERVRAVPAFSAGLRLLPDGQALAERLGLGGERDVETTLRVRSAPPTALGFHRLTEARGARAKAAFLARELVPTTLFMRRRFAIARRGPVGLVLAYLWRPLWLLGHAGAGFLAWRRARRESG
jgi:Uncharacterised nucleotidyltransferase